jgi:hypothetical protein
MQPVSKQRIGKHSSTTVGLFFERCFLFGPCEVVVKKTIGQSSWLRVENPAMKKTFICKSETVKRRIYVCCIYSETVIITVLKSVARIRLVKTEKTKGVIVICKV